MLSRALPTPVSSVAADPQPDELERSYVAARRLTRVHSKSFYAASLVLDEPRKRAIWATYAFCRITDDLVDSAAPASTRLDALAGWECAVRSALAGAPSDARLVAFADAVARFAIPAQPALDLIEGARSDVSVDRYETFDALQRYCYHVAGTVGLLTAPILGHRDGALPYGVALGCAMQMTNILRDIGEDARLGRIYVPQEDLRRFGCTDAQLTAGRVDDRFVALMRFQIARVRRMYAQAEPGIPLLAPRSRYAVRLALSFYRGILDRIERNGYDVFSRRAVVPRAAKLGLALRALRFRTRRRE